MTEANHLREAAEKLSRSLKKTIRSLNELREAIDEAEPPKRKGKWQQAIEDRMKKLK